MMMFFVVDLGLLEQELHALGQGQNRIGLLVQHDRQIDRDLALNAHLGEILVRQFIEL